jgi:O-antigen/teichoic acid export membrane protein
MDNRWARTIRQLPYLFSRFLHRYGSTVLGQGMLLGLGVVTGVIAARALGPTGRGELQAIVLWPMGISALLVIGINQATAFHLGRRILTTSEAVTANVAITLVQSALAVTLGLLVNHFVLHNYSPAVHRLSIIFVLTMPFNLVTTYPPGIFLGLQDHKRFNLIRVIPAVTYFSGLVILYSLHRCTLAGVVWAQIASFFATSAVGCLLILMVLKPRWQWKPGAIRSLTHYGLRTQATSITNYFNQRIDQLLLSIFVPPRELGLYVVAVTLSTAVTFVPGAVGMVTFSRGSSQHVDDARVTIGQSFRVSLLWLVICCTALFILAPFLIHLAFGGAFDGSTRACRILVPGALMIGLNQVLYNGSSAMGRPGLPSIAEGVSVFVTAIGLYLLIPRYGYIGAAIVSTIAYSLSFVIMVVLANRYLGITLRTLFVPGHRPPVSRDAVSRQSLEDGVGR